MNQYKVFDWAGNEKTYFGTHESFEDAWEAVLAYLDTLNLSDAEWEDYCGEYYVDATHD